MAVSEEMQEWEQLSVWAEHEMRLPVRSTTARRGTAAARFGRAVLARAEDEAR
ncbi:hypothetical protein [Prescottella equi]|uniref:hypothetical protein n=1 Tax=Rhodococcus hoagii TaxID=43767 RepID=UPI00384D023B